MVSVLQEYLNIRGGENEDYLFCDEYGGMLSENALRCSVVRYNRSRDVQKTSIHLFRHTFAKKYLIDCGGNAFTLQKLLGHSTLDMTRHYCEIFNADIAKNYDKISPLAQLNERSTKIKISKK
jgi:integrase/recombinase XerD